MTEKNAYSKNYDFASEYLRQAISLLSKHNLPPTPQNYQLLYDHIAGKNQALSQDLKQLLAKADKNLEQQLEQLYERYYAPDKETIELIRKELKQIINKLQDEFGISAGKLSNYAQTLDHFVAILDDSQSMEKHRAETQRVLHETNEVGQSNHQMETQLAKVVDEVHRLRNELDQVKEESMTDTLTGIANRKAFDSTLDTQINETFDYQLPFCLLMADIDHFKRFNDTYGHLVGDKVLRFVAKIISRHIEPDDIVARYGGEEFAIILPDRQENEALRIANELREAVAKGELKDKAGGGNYGRVTMSLGVTQFRPGDQAGNLIQRADRALYLAKDRGRNRVEKL